MDYVYLVISFTTEGTRGGLAGIYYSKEDAIKDVLKSGPHEVWEWAYSILVIEKHRVGSLGHPCLVKDKDREPLLWFMWHCDEPFEEKQTGKYLPCKCPEWGERSFGFV